MFFDFFHFFWMNDLLSKALFYSEKTLQKHKKILKTSESFIKMEW